tara:strand:- start:122 stop:2764 length:2643 start_codon:yes stop_codon:yes gene_type:complete
VFKPIYPKTSGDATRRLLDEFLNHAKRPSAGLILEERLLQTHIYFIDIEKGVLNAPLSYMIDTIFHSLLKWKVPVAALTRITILSSNLFYRFLFPDLVIKAEDLPSIIDHVLQCIVIHNKPKRTQAPLVPSPLQFSKYQPIAYSPYKRTCKADVTKPCSGCVNCRGGVVDGHGLKLSVAYDIDRSSSPMKIREYRYLEGMDVDIVLSSMASCLPDDAIAAPIFAPVGSSFTNTKIASAQRTRDRVSGNTLVLMQNRLGKHLRQVHKDDYEDVAIGDVYKKKGCGFRIFLSHGNLWCSTCGKRHADAASYFELDEKKANVLIQKNKSKELNHEGKECASIRVKQRKTVILPPRVTDVFFPQKMLASHLAPVLGLAAMLKVASPIGICSDLKEIVYCASAANLFRQDGTNVFEEVMDNGEGTRTWKVSDSLTDFVRETLNPGRIGEKLALELRMRDHVSDIVLSIVQTPSNPRFPGLELRETLLGCQNGWYDTELLCFYERDNEDEWGALNVFANTRSGNPEPFTVHPPSDSTACLRYNRLCRVDEETIKILNETEEIVDMNVQHLDCKSLWHVFDSQGHDSNSINVFLTLIGRCFYPLNLHDRWQTMLVFEGVAGTGKSLLLQVIQHAFRTESVFIISAAIQKGFGLQGAQSSRIAVIPELKEEVLDRIEEKNFQSMINGTTISIQQKNKSPSVQAWTQPIVAAGNNNVILTEANGRHPITVIGFPNRVTVQDPSLAARITNEEFLDLMIKTTVSYRVTAATKGDASIEEVYSARMLEDSKATRLRTQSIVRFYKTFCDEDVNEAINAAEFRNRYRAWAADEHQRALQQDRMLVFLAQEGYPVKLFMKNDVQERMITGLKWKTDHVDEMNEQIAAGEEREQ